MSLAKLIQPTGKELPVSPKNGKTFELEELQKLVGGFIEIIYPDEYTALVINEEGKLEGLPFNEPATKLMAGKLFSGDFIVGNAVLCPRSLLGD